MALSCRRNRSVKSMANVVIVGAQWGDEGKGKVVDIYTEYAQEVVRFQGGNNAGHTIYIGKEKYVFHLLPSGIIEKNAVNVIANVKNNQKPSKLSLNCHIKSS